MCFRNDRLYTSDTLNFWSNLKTNILFLEWVALHLAIFLHKLVIDGCSGVLTGLPQQVESFLWRTHPFRWGSGTSVDLAEKRLGFTVVLEGTPNFRPRFAGDQVQLFSSGISDGRKWDISSKAVVTLMSGTERTGHGQLGAALANVPKIQLWISPKNPFIFGILMHRVAFKIGGSLDESNYN